MLILMGLNHKVKLVIYCQGCELRKAAECVVKLWSSSVKTNQIVPRKFLLGRPGDKLISVQCPQIKKEKKKKKKRRKKEKN